MSVIDSRPTAAGDEAPEERDLAGDPARFLNRELQWLAFNERVLHEATDDRTPLLERLRFLAIYSHNLDEFFMKRVGGLRRQVAAGVPVVASEDISPTRLLKSIRERVLPMIERTAACYREQILPELREVGVELIAYDDLAAGERDEVDAWYRDNVFPILTPLAVDPGHRFPFISNLSVSLGVMLQRPGSETHLFARVKVPAVVDQWYQVGDSGRYVPLHDVIEHNLEGLFPGMEISQVLPFRVTRNADVERDNEDADDLLEQIQQELRERRFAPVVRLQIASDPSPEVLQFLCEEMEIAPEEIYETSGLIDYESLEAFTGLDLPEHRYSPWTPVTPQRFRDDEKDVFAVIREGDVLVHHPYESFDATVERLIKEAAADPNVICIKQALYRTSGDSVFVPQLIRAAEAGKQVAVLVELRARFDEARNILWAGKLEDAGVHVAYGVVGLKTHTKIALIVRREAEGIRAYAHIGTGNYNSRTAATYEDFGLFTCDPDITDDVVDLFNYITGRSLQDEYTRLLVAPHGMKRRFLELIEREIGFQRDGTPGRITAKMNQLQDREVIDALYRASRAGVKIDLIVRGFCTLRPGVEGLSENIRVMSVIGRFLEHSRVYHFRGGAADPLEGDFFIGSGDWMYRNMHARVEAVCPVDDISLRARLWRTLQLCVHDQRQCWDMQRDGTYTQRRPSEGDDDQSEAALGTHESLMRLARSTDPRRERE